MRSCDGEFISTWSAFARVNTVDRETLALMREAGCDSVSFGVETGNVEMLKRIQKGITLEQVKRSSSVVPTDGDHRPHLLYRRPSRRDTGYAS